MKHLAAGCQRATRRVNRNPSEYISEADRAAMRNDQAFGATAPETAASSPPARDTASVVSETTASAVDLTNPRDWAENYRRRPPEPPVNTHNVPDREVRASGVVVNFFEDVRTAGMLYPNFRLGLDAVGEVIDLTRARTPEWHRVDHYQWAVFAHDRGVCPAHFGHQHGAEPRQSPRFRRL